MDHSVTSTPNYTETNNENLTKLENDLVFLEHEFEHYHNIYVFVVQYFITVGLFLESLAVLGSLSFLSFLIYKFKRLRTRPNFIVIHLIVSSFIFVLTALSECILCTYTEYFPDAYLKVKYLYYFIVIACFASINSNMLLALLLAIDWYISTKCPNFLLTYQKWNRYIIISIYAFACKDGLLFLFFKDIRDAAIIIIEIYAMALIFTISSIIVVVFYLIKRHSEFSPEQSKTEYTLTIPCAFFLMWMPMVCTLVGGIIVLSLTTIQIDYKYSVMLTLVIFVFVIFASAAPLVYIHLLGKLDKNFRAAYEYVLKKAVRQYTQHDCDEELIEDV